MPRWTLADRGFHVFPLGRGSKVPRKDFKRWELRATRDPLQVAEWWKRWPGSNPGVACKPSVILVVDLDVPKGNRTEDGRQVFWDLIKSLKIPWEPTRQVRTPSGGVHLYYKRTPRRVLEEQRRDVLDQASTPGPSVATWSAQEA